MNDLFDLVGEDINIIRDPGKDHFHFRERVIVLRRNYLLARSGTSIHTNDILFINEAQYHIKILRTLSGIAICELQQA